MEGLASGEDAVWLRPWWDLLVLGDLFDTVAAVTPLVIKGRAFRAGVHYGLAAGTGLRLACLCNGG